MARFQITSPEGEKFEITAPDTATEQEVMAYAQEQFKKPKMQSIGREAYDAELKKTVSEAPILSQAVAGAAGRVQQMGQGLRDAIVKGLVGAGPAGPIISALAQRVTPSLAPETVQEAGQIASATPAATGGAIGADLAATLIPGARLQQAVTRQLGGGALAKTAGAAAAGGAVSQATGGDALTGAGVAAGVDAATRGLGRVARPIIQSEPVKKLMSEGIVPTPGQAAGGMVGRIEEGLSSLPIVGSFIRQGRSRAAEELNLAALKRSLPKAERAAFSLTGRKGLEEAENILGAGYDRVLGNIGVINVPKAFTSELDDIAAKFSGSLTDAGEAQLGKVIKGRVLKRMEGGRITGELAKRVDSELGTIVRQYRSSSDAGQREFANAVAEVQGKVKSMLSANAQGADAAALKELDKSWANVVRVQRATGMLGAEDGVFSAAQLQNAVKATDKRNFAKGKALMQDLSDPAKSVLGDKVPNSGTADRALTALLLGSAGANEYYGGPGYLSALALSPLIYSRVGSRYMAGSLPGQQMVGDALMQAAPFAAQIGRASKDR